MAVVSSALKATSTGSSGDVHGLRRCDMASNGHQHLFQGLADLWRERPGPQLSSYDPEPVKEPTHLWRHLPDIDLHKALQKLVVTRAIVLPRKPFRASKTSVERLIVGNTPGPGRYNRLTAQVQRLGAAGIVAVPSIATTSDGAEVLDGLERPALGLLPEETCFHRRGG